MMLSGKTAIVTGGSRGIGRAIVERFVHEGATVVFSFHRNKAAADELAARLDRATTDPDGTTLGRAIAVAADQADVSTIDALFEPVGDGLDILVNNVAINPSVPVAEVTEDDFRRVMTVNSLYPLLAMRRAAALLRDGGRIINISTLNTVIPAPGHSLYAASKAALEQFTAVAARELGTRGITVNTVSPGATDTDLLRATNPPEALAQIPATTALQRLGQPADIANVVTFLAGPDSQWVTGQNIRATGGLLI